MQLLNILCKLAQFYYSQKALSALVSVTVIFRVKYQAILAIPLLL